MSQPGNYTPIQLYYSTTASAAPLAANLANGELAINITDGKLYYKDNSGVVQLIASKNAVATAVTAVSVASANGFAGTSSGGTTPALTLSTTVTGLLKGNGTAVSAAVSGTDYAPATSGTAILYGNGSGGFASVSIGTGISFAGGTLSATGSGGTVTSVGMTVPSFLSVSGSPVTGSGTLAVSYSGTALPVANGGTGSTTLTANNVLLGNGTSALQTVAPGTTGNVLTSNGTTWVSQAVSGGSMTVTTYTAQSANITLSSANANSIINFTLANDITVTMPDATTLTGARNFTIKNNDTTYGVVIYDNAGNYLFTLPPGTGNTIWASSISTAAGEWTAQDEIYDYLSQETKSGLIFSNVSSGYARKNVTALSATQVVQVYYWNASVFVVVGTYSGGTISYGTPVFVTADGTYPTVCTLSATSGIIAWTDTKSGVFAKVFTVSGSAITLGSTYTTSPSFADGYVSISSMSSSTAVLGFQQNQDIYVQQLSVSGTTITSTTSVYKAVSADSSGYYIQVLALSSNTVALIYPELNAYQKVVVGTVSGSTWSFGAANTDSSNASYQAYAVALSSTSFATVFTDSATIFGKVYTVSGTTITAGSKTTLITSANSSFPSISALSSTSLVVIYDNTSSRLMYATTYTVSGTTITASGSATALTTTNSTGVPAYTGLVGLQSFAVASPSASTFFASFSIFGCVYGLTFSVSGSTVTSLATQALTQNNLFSVYTSRPAAAFNKTQFLYLTNQSLSTSTQRYSLVATLYGVSNTTITSQNSVTVASTKSTSSGNYTVCCVSPTVAVIAYSDTNGYMVAAVVTRSGTSISVGTPVTIDSSSTSFTCATMTMLSATTVMLSYGSSQTVKNVVLTISGTTLSAGTAATFVPQAGYTISYLSTAALSSSYVIVSMFNGAYARAYGLTISGTTITVTSSNYYAGLGDGTPDFPQVTAISSSQALFTSQASLGASAFYYDNYYGFFYGMLSSLNGAVPTQGNYIGVVSTFNDDYHTNYMRAVILPVSASSGVFAGYGQNSVNATFVPYSVNYGEVKIYQGSSQVAQPMSQYQYYAFYPTAVILADPAVGPVFSSEFVLITGVYTDQDGVSQDNTWSFRKYNSKGAIK